MNCKQCGRVMDIYYIPWCPLCDKPEIKATPTLNFVQALEHLEALGHTGIKERVWDYCMDDVYNEHTFSMYLPSEDERTDYADVYEDLALIKSTWNITTDHISMFVSY